MPDAPEARTEQPDEVGVASDPPPGLTAVIWIGVFSVLVLGFGVLFGLRPKPPGRPPFSSAEPPARPEDVTLEEPGPDR